MIFILAIRPKRQIDQKEEDQILLKREEKLNRINNGETKGPTILVSIVALMALSYFVYRLIEAGTPKGITETQQLVKGFDKNPHSLFFNIFIIIIVSLFFGYVAPHYSAKLANLSDYKITLKRLLIGLGFFLIALIIASLPLNSSSPDFISACSISGVLFVGLFFAWKSTRKER